MIKKRLLSLMGDSGKYIKINLLWQWLGLIISAVLSLFAALLLESAKRLGVEDVFADPLQIVKAAAVIGVLLVIKNIFVRKATKASFMAGRDVKCKLRTLLYEKLSKLGISYHEQVPTAEAVRDLLRTVYTSAYIQPACTCNTFYYDIIRQFESGIHTSYMCSAYTCKYHGRTKDSEKAFEEILVGIYRTRRQFS